MYVVYACMFISLHAMCICTLSDVDKTSNMSRKMKVQEAMEYILDQDSDLDEDVSESEDNLEINSDHDAKLSDDEGIISPSSTLRKTFILKNDQIEQSSSPNMRQGTISAPNIIKAVPGTTKIQCSDS